MPALPVAPGVVRVQQSFHDPSRGWSDSFHVAHLDSSAWSVAELGALAAQVNPLLATVYQGVMASTASGDGTTCRDLSDDTGRVNFAGPGFPGGVVEPSLPISNTICTTFRIARTYRGGHPRFNCSAIASTVLLTPISWDPSLLGTIDVNWVALIEAIAGNDTLGSPVAVVGLSYFLNKVVRPHGVFFPVTGVETQQRVCTLRKRLGKGISER